jgi:hypothetical protein
LAAKSCAISRRAFCSSVSVKSTTVIVCSSRRLTGQSTTEGSIPFHDRGTDRLKLLIGFGMQELKAGSCPSDDSEHRMPNAAPPQRLVLRLVYALLLAGALIFAAFTFGVGKPP